MIRRVDEALHRNNYHKGDLHAADGYYEITCVYVAESSSALLINDTIDEYGYPSGDEHWIPWKFIRTPDDRREYVRGDIIKIEVSEFILAKRGLV